MNPRKPVMERLRETGDHYKRRLTRIEYLAADGRVDFATFQERRAYIEGLGDAYEQALAIIGDARVDGEPDPDLACVLEGARSGRSVEAIAAMCGLTEREVAEALVRYVRQFDQEKKP